MLINLQSRSGNPKLKRYVVGLLAAIPAGWLVLMLMLRHTFLKGAKPLFLNYTSDTFNYGVWKWRWNWQPTRQQWQITNLRPYCPVCKARLTVYKTAFGERLLCPKGGNEHDHFGDKQVSSKQIEGLILEQVSLRYTTDQSPKKN